MDICRQESLKDEEDCRTDKKSGDRREHTISDAHSADRGSGMSCQYFPEPERS